MSESSESEFDDTLTDVKPFVDNITSEDLLPEKSKHIYEKYYGIFMDWRQTNNINSFSENDLLEFFKTLKWKSSTLWKMYSMLKAMINVKHNIDISKYNKLKAFLKRSSNAYSPKKSNVFTPDNIKKFLEDAPDSIYLAAKTILIIGIVGGCRKHELHGLKVSHVRDLNSVILFSIPNTKTKASREFTVSGYFYNIVKKYCALRPSDVPFDNFFLNYQKGKCTRQVIGINKLSTIPKQIAKFLNLENPDNYTGHCFRRTSATMFINAGSGIIILKGQGELKPEVAVEYGHDRLNSEVGEEYGHGRLNSEVAEEYEHGRVKSEVAEECIDSSLQNHINVADRIVTSILRSDSLFTRPSTSSESEPHTTTSSSANQIIIGSTSENISNAPVFRFNNCQNTINIIVNIKK